MSKKRTTNFKSGLEGRLYERTMLHHLYFEVAALGC